MKKPALFLLFTFLSSFLIAEDSYQQKIDSLFNEYQKDFPNTPYKTPDELDQLPKPKRLVFVDVRRKKERNVSMIPGAISKKEFFKDKEYYRGHIVIPYCTIGSRSGFFTKKLRKKGYEAYNLKGSILLWIHSGRAVVNKDGETKQVHVYGPNWNLVPQGYNSVW